MLTFTDRGRGWFHMPIDHPYVFTIGWSQLIFKHIQRLFYCQPNKPAAQAAGQTLPDSAPTVGKVHPFRKIAVTVEPIQQFICPSRFRISEKIII